MIFPERKLKCGDCCVCCKLGNLTVPLELEEEKDVELFRAVKYKGLLTLGRSFEIPKKGNGHCTHLKRGRCSIYDRRPTNCAGFDCRSFLNADEFYYSTGQKRDVRRLAKAAAKLHTRMKQSTARRFNDLLKETK